MKKEKEQTAKTSKVPLESVPLAVIPTTTLSTASTTDEVEQLTKALKNMSIKEDEINKLQDQVQLLQYHKSKD